MALIVEQAGAQGLEHARTGVVGGAAAESENQAFGAGVEGGTDQLADPERRAVQRAAGLIS